MYLSIIISTIVVVVLWIVEWYCSKLKNPIWGGIIPLLTLVASIYILASGLIAFDLTSFIIFLGLNIFMFEGWSESRERYRKRQKLELDKMKAKDIDD